MPRKPRIEIPGYYHIINRGVEQRVIFKSAEDYEYFEELMCFYTKSYGITLHNYCLMSNHYHLLIEITGENLSKYMRQLNMNYAIYFNKKYTRSGHLWQGRFKLWVGLFFFVIWINDKFDKQRDVRYTLFMGKIDEVKEILNTLRVAMSIVAGIIVVLVGRLFSKFEKSEFDLIFWLLVIITLIAVVAETLIVFNISKKTKEIKDL